MRRNQRLDQRCHRPRQATTELVLEMAEEYDLLSAERQDDGGGPPFARRLIGPYFGQMRHALVGSADLCRVVETRQAVSCIPPLGQILHVVLDPKVVPTRQ